MGVCAVFAYNRKCSDEDGVGYVSVTTLPPQQQGAPSPQGASGFRPCPSTLFNDVRSFKAVNWPGFFMRHRNFLGVLTEVRSDLDKADSTFIIHYQTVPPFAWRFEAFDWPGYFLRHQSFRLTLQKNDGSDLFAKDSSFIMRGNVGKGPIRFESVNFLGYFIRHKNFELWLEKSDGSNLFDKDSAWLFEFANC